MGEEPSRRVRAVLAALNYCFAYPDRPFKVSDIAKHVVVSNDRTVRRALNDLESANWVERRSSHYWAAGSKVQQADNRDFWDAYVSE